MAGEVRFRILGPLGVSVDGQPIAIGAPRQRALLAILLLDANRVQNPPSLIDGIWGDATPKHPDAALQIVVSRLRTALGPLSDRLASESGGYRIHVADEELDLLRARRDLQRARDLWLENDFVGSAALADAALRCWVSEPFTDLRDARFYDSARQDLRELQLTIYGFRTRAYLRCGRHVEVLADIETWSRMDPWHERIRAHHMIALYRSGRRVDALAVYEDMRQCLADDLGVDPSTYMQELHKRIVAQDLSLLARRAGIVAALPVWTSSHLPYVGRHREETQIFERLQEVAAGASRMVLVEGEAGIGKSRLVLEAARRAHDDAIVLAVDGADALQPGLQMIAAALAQASSQLSDAELELCLGRWPGDLAEIVPALHRRLPDLPPALAADTETRSARLRAAIVSWIAALSQRAPVVLMVDDIHRAGPALLVLLGAVLVDDEPKRVLVLATARSGVADRSSRLEQLARSLDARGVLDRIELHGLTADSVTRLLSELGRPEVADLAEQLALTTHGHPYLLGELLREPDPSTASADAAADVTSRIRGFVLRRVSALGEPGARLLGIAAALDGEFDVALLAEVAHGTPQTTQVFIDRAVDHGLLHVTGAGSFDFVHDLARRAIAESVDADVRAIVHHEIAVALERDGASSARIASQWSHAAGVDASARTCAWAERAGDEALSHLDPHAAAGWFELAAAHAVDDRARAHLLIRLADAQCQAGEWSGADTLRSALEVAQRLDDDDLFVHAATLPAPIWRSMPTLSARERASLLAEGSSRARDVGTRARLLARLATELVVTSQWLHARALAEQALEAVRTSDDRSAHAEVLLRHAHVTNTPHNLRVRRHNLREAVAITATQRDPVSRFYALAASAAAAVEAASIDQADVYVEAAYALGREFDIPMLAFNVECMRAWRADLAGDLDEAERLAVSAIELGERNGVANAAIGPSLELGSIRWQQGRLGELLPILRASSHEGDRGGSILLARGLAAFDEHRAEAVQALRTAAANGFEDLPLGSLWAGELVVAGEAAFMLGCADVGRTVRELLEPFVDQSCFNGMWIAAPIAYGVALGAAAAGEPGVDDFFEQARSVCAGLRAPMLRARTEQAWDCVRAARGDGATAARTAAHL